MALAMLHVFEPETTGTNPLVVRIAVTSGQFGIGATVRKLDGTVLGPVTKIVSLSGNEVPEAISFTCFTLTIDTTESLSKTDAKLAVFEPL